MEVANQRMGRGNGSFCTAISKNFLAAPTLLNLIVLAHSLAELPDESTKHCLDRIQLGRAIGQVQHIYSFCLRKLFYSFLSVYAGSVKDECKGHQFGGKMSDELYDLRHFEDIAFSKIVNYLSLSIQCNCEVNFVPNLFLLTVGSICLSAVFNEGLVHKYAIIWFSLEELLGENKASLYIFGIVLLLWLWLFQLLVGIFAGVYVFEAAGDHMDGNIHFELLGKHGGDLRLVNVGILLIYFNHFLLHQPHLAPSPPLSLPEDSTLNHRVL